MYFIYAGSVVHKEWLDTSQPDKKEGQIIYHSHSNSKTVETTENCCQVKIGSADVLPATYTNLCPIRWLLQHHHCHVLYYFLSLLHAFVCCSHYFLFLQSLDFYHTLLHNFCNCNTFLYDPSVPFILSLLQRYVGYNSTEMCLSIIGINVLVNTKWHKSLTLKEYLI